MNFSPRPGKMAYAGKASKLTFYVNGDAGGNLAWSSESDARSKEDVEPISDALDKVLSLQGVNFSWKDDQRRAQGKQMGFIVQQAEPIIPEVVINKGDHYAMQYAPITALLADRSGHSNGKENTMDSTCSCIH